MKVYGSLFVIAKRVETTQMSLIFYTDKYSLYIYTTEYCYSATENNEPLTHSTPWVNLKYVMLSERCQAQKLQDV